MENKNLVRFRKIELAGFKNVKYGLIQMPSEFEKSVAERKADILGIYGQNGSGKTAVVEAMGFVQELLKGNSLPASVCNYISKETKKCSIKVGFTVETDVSKALADYYVEIVVKDDNNIAITRETLSARLWNSEKFETKKDLIIYSADDEAGGAIFTPAYRFHDLIRGDEDNIINLAVAKRIAEKEHCSFIFGLEGIKVFTKEYSKAINKDYADLILALRRYACIDLFVISNEHTGVISLNLAIPVTFRLDYGEGIAKGDLPIRLDRPAIIEKREFEIAKELIEGMNVALRTVIPEMSIKLHNLGEQTLEDGKEGYRIELLSQRDEVEIPLRYESEGIIKIISILNVLMCVYNNQGMCLVIDELDSGIFEFLLGELLVVFERGAKGQLIFTSHNLRALEMLNKNSIIFSTTNAENRYIRFTNIKKNHNLRDSYLRTITLGGQREIVYEETDSVEIGRAFRRAGKAVLYGKES